MQSIIDQYTPGSRLSTWLFARVYFSFSLVYLLQSAIELITQPWQIYFVHGGRLFELAINIVVSIISIAWVLPFIDLEPRFMRYANVVRVLKLTDLLFELSSDFNFVLTALA